MYELARAQKKLWVLQCTGSAEYISKPHILLLVCVITESSGGMLPGFAPLLGFAGVKFSIMEPTQVMAEPNM